MKAPKLIRVVLFAFLLLFSLSTVNATVEVFSEFNTILTINKDNTVDINKSLAIKNVFDVGIVPGQVEFKVARGTEGSINDIEIIDVVARDEFGNEIKTVVRNGEDFSVVILDVFYPLLPGFEYSFDLYYKLKYKPGGIFFKSLQIPLRESTIPIEDGAFQVNLPSGNDFTFVSEEGFVESANGQATWQIIDDKPDVISFEYSYLPIKTAGIARGSYVFWVVINLVLLVVLVFEIRRGVKRIKERYNQGGG